MELSPRAVYDDPAGYWQFLTQSADNDFEGQHFERKEAGRKTSNARALANQVRQFREGITKTISGFANSNVEGGLLVIGIASNGDVQGISHLTEEQKNSLTNIGLLLINQAAEAKLHRCTDVSGQSNAICLIFVPYSKSGICETPGASPSAWERRAPQNVPVA